MFPKHISRNNKTDSEVFRRGSPFTMRGSQLGTFIASDDTHGHENLPTAARVLPSIRKLPVGTSLNNITLPYFDITSFEWIREQNELPLNMTEMIKNLTGVGTKPDLLGPVDGNTLLNSTTP